MLVDTCNIIDDIVLMEDGDLGCLTVVWWNTFASPFLNFLSFEIYEILIRLFAASIVNMKSLCLVRDSILVFSITWMLLLNRRIKNSYNLKTTNALKGGGSNTQTMSITPPLPCTSLHKTNLRHRGDSVEIIASTVPLCQRSSIHGDKYVSKVWM